jgi:iron complex transport system substrate-binding protein
MTGRLALQGSTANRTGRVHGIWSGLALSPVLLPVLVDCLARWLHPGACAEADPARTLARINGFFAQPIPGPLWLSLRDG